MMTGDRLDAMHFFKVVDDNDEFTGSPEYDSRVKWVCKRRKEDGRVAEELLFYSDYFRPTAPDEEECWCTFRKAGSTLNYLGFQEAPRKHQPGSMTPGPCQGHWLIQMNGRYAC
jgi:hypothetical protein